MPKVRSKLIKLYCAAWLACASSTVTVADEHATPTPPEKHALVIGNSNYEQLQPIPSAQTDAVQVANKLQQLGFDVQLELDVPDFRDFEDRVLPAFRAKIDEGDFIVVYYSGHGFSHGPHNMLAYTRQPKKLDAKRVAVDALPVDAMEAALARRNPGLIITILDACRSIGDFVIEADGRAVGIPKGLSSPQSELIPVNIMTAFATRPGAIAEGNNVHGSMSAFSKALVDHIVTQGKRFSSIFQQVAAEVSINTNDSQIPGLHAYSPTDPVLSPTDEVIAHERELWESAYSSRNRRKVQTFLRLNSVGHFARAARLWLSRNPESRAQSFTRISPISIEQGWEQATASIEPSDIVGGIVSNAETVVVPRIEMPIAFERSAAAFSGTGVPVPGLNATACSGTGSRSPECLTEVVGSGFQTTASAVLTRSLTARAAPQPDARTVRLNRLSRVNVQEVVVQQASGRSSNRSAWLKVDTGGEQVAFVPIGQPTIRQESLGRPLAEIIVAQRSASETGLVDADMIARTLKQLRSSGRRVTWVSLSPGKGTTEKDALVNELLAADAHNKMSSMGVSRLIMTEAPPFDGDGVRIRILGY